ncbi:YbhB/YbcL family Raf kinase inhibitor-like protein [Ureaplasma urealyticum]|uniref:YbhB/YbcL family Raf kinase inhibitor-like protein n=1 Tax=Ureaplasma urealyticum TaxID=2130 RepID=UPI000303CD87|nr:YbhB/YbcL family Raf kinase inhibitor-like protein [Ureaplasma urealyticum]
MVEDKFLKQIKEGEQIKIEIKGLDEFNNFDEQSYGLNNISPQMRWSPVLEAASYAVAIIDYEAVGGAPFVHWYALNIFEPQLELNVANLGYANLYQGENSTSKHFTHSTVDANYQTDVANNYFPPCPPNKAHKYEIKIYAVHHKMSTNRNKILYLDDFEAKLNEAKIIAMGSTYVYAPQISFENNELVVGSLERKHPYLFTDAKNEYHVIEDVIVDDIEKNVYDETQLNNFQDLEQAKIKIIDSSDALSYAVIISSNHTFKKYGRPIINYAHIVEKKSNKRIKFNNSYKLNHAFSDISPSKYEHLGNELLILKDNDANIESGLFTIHVFGLNKKINQLNKVENPTDSIIDLFEMISGNVISYKAKFFKL